MRREVSEDHWHLQVEAEKRKGPLWKLRSDLKHKIIEAKANFWKC